MSSRQTALLDIARSHQELTPQGEYNVCAEFARYVFSDTDQRERLPKSVYKQVKAAEKNRTRLPADVIEVFATVLKEWAVEHGATHYAHQFQPLTGKTAEKHDSFMELDGTRGAITEFSGTLLSMGEPDGSSFPVGDLRTTSCARGYTFWATNLPIYIRTGTLIIPTIFLAWTGDALDFLYPTIRSSERVSNAIVGIYSAIYGEGNHEVTSAWSSLGCEQEYFLVDRGLFLQRPDLIASGRAVFGRLPAKHQQADDHYFGTVPPRVLAFMQDTERELWKYGVPVKTRHNEVAPSQFETAPIFEESTVAIAHNNLEMTVMQECARRHGLEMLLHEKPFGGVNGSGKHNNYSFSTNTGTNLFEPTSDPMTAKPFLAALAATMRAVDLHPDMLRMAISVYGNDFRLGAAEAPPAIMSIFLGAELENCVQRVCDGELQRGVDPSKALRTHEINLTHHFPKSKVHSGDRNRTSPMAFTGNKFEFRAVGSSQNCCLPVTVLNTITADSLDAIAAEIEAKVAAGAGREAAFNDVIRDTMTKHRRVVFNGNGYSEEWVKEAEKRGLPNIKTAAEAIVRLTDEKNVKLFEGVLSEAEITARREVFLEQYSLAIEIEAKTAVKMAKSMILPCAQRRQKESADSVVSVSQVPGIDCAAQTEELKKLVALVSDFVTAIGKVEEGLAAKPHGDADGQVEAFYMRQEVFPRVQALRTIANKIEGIVEDRDWPLPTFAELLFAK